MKVQKSRHNSSTNVTYSHCLKVCVSEHVWCMSTSRIHEEKQRLFSDQIFHIDVWLHVCFSKLRFLGLQMWPLPSSKLHSLADAPMTCLATPQEEYLSDSTIVFLIHRFRITSSCLCKICRNLFQYNKTSVDHSRASLWASAVEDMENGAGKPMAEKSPDMKPFHGILTQSGDAIWLCASVPQSSRIHLVLSFVGRRPLYQVMTDVGILEWRDGVVCGML